MEKSMLKKKLEESPDEKFDDVIEKCVICSKQGITKFDHKSVCAKHYVEIEDEECMKALLKHEIETNGKITEPIETQIEIKKQMPKLYEQLKGFFQV